MIDGIGAGDQPELLAESAALAALAPDAAELSGWVARDAAGVLVGAVVDLPGRAADGAAGTWFASSSRALDDLYTVAAQAWVGRGLLTHRVVLGRGDPLEPALVDLGFGHQQAYAHAPLDEVQTRLARRPSAPVEVRPAGSADLQVLGELVPLVPRHQEAAPAFAPRTPEFFDQLDASLAEFVDDVDREAWLAWDSAEPAGFVLVEHEGDETEVVLAGTLPYWRGRGVAHALVAAAAGAAAARRAVRMTADWRTTNRLAARFWPSLGFTVDAYRWSRTIDATPT